LRESLIVFTAIPVTLALTLTIFYLYGYTLNRITLFALIFSIGILVDDAIVVVENIVRHWRMPGNETRPPFEVALEAVDEVGNPTILATLAVVAAILPMAFVGGLMGPYMRPIPIGASAAMLFSLLVAFIVTPWAAVRILKPGGVHNAGEREAFVTRLYRRVMGSLLHRPLFRWSFVGGVVVLLLASCALFYTGFVKVKMLPFDNKSEFQVIVDMPNGTTLEQTARVVQLLGEETQKQREVVNIQTYAGTASPYNFNGLVRHYYMRRGPNRRAPWCPHQGGRSAARTACAGDTGRGSIRASDGGADCAGAANSRSVQGDQGRCRCRLVRGRRSDQVPLFGGRREGRPQRHFRG
jgi:multidrug efflux pump subunit AcrB